jgi:hypothetical protein
MRRYQAFIARLPKVGDFRPHCQRRLVRRNLGHHLGQCEFLRVQPLGKSFLVQISVRLRSPQSSLDQFRHGLLEPLLPVQAF